MTNIKIHRHEKNFSTIYNDVLQIKTLSYKAKGLWAFIMSLPPNFQLTTKFLEKNSAEGIDGIRSILNELIKHGIVKRTQKPTGGNGKKGGFSKMEYTIFEKPDISNNLCGTGFSGPAYSLSLIRTNSSVQDLSKKPPQTPPLEPEAPDKGFFDKSNEEEEVLGLWIQDRTGCDEERARAAYWNAKSFEVRNMLKKDKESFMYIAIKNNYSLRESFHEKNRCISFAIEKNSKNCYTDDGLLHFDFCKESIHFTSKDFIDILINIIKTYKVESLAKYLGINL